MGWWNRRPATLQVGSALFRGRWKPRPEDFAASLAERGVTLGAAARDGDGGWRVPLAHDAWGRGTLVFAHQATPPPSFLVDLDPRLTDAERGEVKACQTIIGVTAEPRGGNVLADRKDHLRFLHAVMGAEGIAAQDHTAQSFWSRHGLEDELAHDAELDIDAIYTLHLIQDDEGRPTWLHSHGLSGIGFWDFDILDPSPDLAGPGHDVVRAIAFAVVEGRLEPGGPPHEIVTGVSVRAVPARELLARLPASAHRAYRAEVDEDHVRGHAVLCEPGGRGLFGRLLGRPELRPSRFLSSPLPEEGLIQYSDSASALMARRARDSLPRLRAALEELAEIEPVGLVKLGYEVDGGDGKENLWFRVHGFDGDAVDATLVNAPFHIARMKENDRGTHSLERLSDWAILTPVGRIDPRASRTLRQIRDNWDQLRELVAESKGAGG